MERLNPLNDFLFLKLMGEEGSEVQCLAFLNAVLGAKSNRTGGSQTSGSQTESFQTFGSIAFSSQNSV